MIILVLYYFGRYYIPTPDLRISACIGILRSLALTNIEWHGLGGAIAAHETSLSSLGVVYLHIVDCCVPRALAGIIKVEQISERLIPRPTTKIARDLWSRAPLMSLSDPLNLPMR